MNCLRGFLWCLLLVTLFACGGGGGGGTTIGLAKPKVSIAWGPRSRAIDGPSSALSAVITLANASATGANVSYSVDRSGPVSGSTVVYTGPEDVKVQPTSITVNFYASAGGAGALVGTATGAANISSNGTVSTSISTVGVINSVDVPTNQVVTIAETLTLNFGAKDAQNNLVAVSPGSALWNVTAGSDKLTFANGDATGVAAGNATVTATIEGKVSIPTVVAVTDPASITVSVSPTTVSVAPNGTQPFSAQVNGTGNTAVTWSVVDAGGGTITTGGLYTAPATLASYTVKATSVANPAKFGTATVNVETITVSIAPLTQSILKQDTLQFTPTVTGSTNHAVTWSVLENNGGTVDSSGLYTAPNALGTYTVRATSQANPSFHGEATVTVPAWILTNIHPAGSNGSEAYGGAGFTQVGVAYIGGVQTAGLWTSSSGSFVNLNPTGSNLGLAYAASNTNQVGWAQFGSTYHASLWTGTSASWVDLKPGSSGDSYAFATSGPNQVGYATIGGNWHASLWSGSAGSWVDLNPAPHPSSIAFGVSGSTQVGRTILNAGGDHASLWTGTAASWVDLNPAGAAESEAYGASSANQVGYFNPGSGRRACLWSGSAGSYIDLHPAGTTGWSIANSTIGSIQVGYAEFAASPHAGYWTGNAASWVDLHPAGYSDSHANYVSTDGTYVYIVGRGGNNSTSQQEALLWKMKP